MKDLKLLNNDLAFMNDELNNNNKYNENDSTPNGSRRGAWRNASVLTPLAGKLDHFAEDIMHVEGITKVVFVSRRIERTH